MPNPRSTLSDSGRSTTGGQVVGYHFPPIGRKCPRIACFLRKRVPAFSRLLRPCRPISVRFSSCATSRDGRRKKPAPSSASPRSIRGYSYIVHAPKFGVCLSSTSRKSRVLKIFGYLEEEHFG